MSKLSNKELLIWLKNAEHERLIYMPKYTLEQERQAYLQIKDLIQNQPEVSLKDIYDFHNNLFTIVEDEPDIDDEYLAEKERKYIKSWLENNGVKIKE